MAEPTHSAWWISLHPRPVSLLSPTATNDTVNASSSLHVALNTSAPLQQTLSEVLFQPYFRTLSTDIFTGQIIASLIVLAFLAVFLLREWIQQNARPGVFDDGPVAEVPAPVDPQPQAEPDHEEPAANDEPQPENAEVDEIAAVLPPLRPLPDVPEDIRPADPSSSSSSSSSDTEAPPSRSASTHLEDPLPAFGRRRRGIAKRKLRGVNANRKLHIMEDDEPDVMIDTRLYRVKREYDESLHWEAQSEQSSGSGRSSRSGLYALEGGPKSAKAAGKQVEKEFAGGAGSKFNFEAGSKTRQKRKTSNPDTEFTSRESSASSSARRSSSPASPDFEFTFTAPRFPSGGPSTFPATFALPQNGEFTLRPKTRSTPSSSTPSSPTVHSSALAQSLNPDSSYASTVSAVPSPYSNSLKSRPTFELPPPSETSRVKLNELPYPLSPRSAPPSTSSGSLLFPEDGERTTFQFHSSHQPLASPSASSSSVPNSPRRPLLPASTFPKTEHVNAEASTSAAGAVADAPLSSSHLAIYRPPEELEVEDKKEYFGSNQPSPEDHAGEEEEEEEDDETRFAYYFQEPEQDDAREMPPPLLPDSDDEDEDDDGHDGDEPREGVDARPPAPVVREAGGQDMDAEPADDERDQNLEEDLDGAMEGIYALAKKKGQAEPFTFVALAVGLRGPVFSVFQNVGCLDLSNSWCLK